MNDAIMKAIKMVGNNVAQMAGDPKKVGENFMPLSTASGLSLGAIALTSLSSTVAETAGAEQYLDLHAMIGGYETNLQIGLHVGLYAAQIATIAYSAYLVGKPAGAKINEEA